MRYSLSKGSASGGALAIISGATTIVTTDADFWGWAAVAVGLLVWSWSFSINGEQWWRRWLPEAPRKSPIRVAGKMHIDCIAVTDEWGVALTPLWAVSFCLQVKNVSADGRTLRGVQARSEDVYKEGSRTPLLFRQGNDLVPTIDLKHDQVGLLEIGFVFVDSGPSNPPVCERDVQYRKHVRHKDMHLAFANAATDRVLQLSGDEQIGYVDGGNFRVVIVAEEVTAYRRKFEVDFSKPDPAQWIGF